MSHTPGPWYSMKEGAIVPLKSIYCEQLGFQIGFVNTDRKSVDIEAHDNAQLIAAAPDLLAALRFILAFYEPGQTYLDTEAWKRAEASARAAVAKATGEKA